MSGQFSNTSLKKSRLWLVAILLLISCFYLFNKPSSPNPEGYCAEKKRFLTDEEFIENAIKSLRLNSEKTRPDIDWSESSSISNFHKNHPDCCNIERRSAWKEYGQNWEAIVAITYKTVSKDYSRDEPAKYLEFVSMDECGYPNN